MTRRIVSFIAAATLLACVSTTPSTASESAEARARKILERVPLIDGHNDVPWALREQFHNQLARVDLNSTTDIDQPMHTDIPRLRRGMVGAQFWSVYVPASLPEPEAVLAVLEQIDITKRFTAKHRDVFEMAMTADDIERIHRSGKIASLIGIEGGHAIGSSLGALRQLYELGARYMTLTHSANTPWADSSTDDPVHDGLSPFGMDVVREMARLGMLIDLSHVSESTMMDVLDLVSVPVVFSHSSARALTGHPRNVPDSVLRRLPLNGGVVMVTFVPPFVSEEQRTWRAEESAEEARLKSLFSGDPARVQSELETWKEANPVPRATLSQVADHIEHIRDVAGVDHIGIGSDFDGISSVPLGLEDVTTFPALFAEMLDRGWSEEDLEKLAGRNVLRVMRSVEKAAMSSSLEPIESRMSDYETE